MVQEAKAALRDEVRARLKRLSPEQQLVASAQARSRLVVQPDWQKAQSILFFAPLPEELDIWPLLTEALSAGKLVALPRFVAASNHYVACPIRDLSRDLKTGRFGIREPAEDASQAAVKRLDFILVPGVAFDPHGRRLGRGKGYYDRLLGGLRGTTCGVAFDEQIVPAIPVGPHDAHVNCILTPTRWMKP